MNKQRLQAVALTAALSATALLGNGALADTLDNVLRVGQARAEAGRESQQRIDQITSETEKLLAEFKQVNKEIEGLKVYNAQLEKQIQSQEQELVDLDEAIDNVQVIERQITPLMIRMIDSLDQFVELDLPFHLEERRDRVAKLRDNLDRSDLSIAEQFRQVLEAYSIENEYGRKVDTYTGELTINGQPRQVEFLRVGRVGLLYQTIDQEITGAWNQRTRQWEVLDSGEYQNAVRKGIQIAAQRATVDIMQIPVSAPEEAK